MPFVTLDRFEGPLQWAAFDAADAPSSEILCSLAPDGPPRAASGAMQVALSGAAAGHRLERAIPAIDLSPYTDLTLWVRSDAAAGATPGASFRLRLELGSFALAIGAPGNSWHRYLAPLDGRGWHYLRFLLEDLPPALRSAVATVAITVEATEGAHMLWLAAIEAQQRQPTADVEEGLLAALDGALQLGGNPVEAVIAPDTTAAPAEPHFRIEAVRTALSPKRAVAAGSPTDFTATGYRWRPPPEPWDLYYAIACNAPTRAEAAPLHDFLLARFGQSGWLQTGNRALRIESVEGVVAQPGIEAPDHRRFLRVGAWVERGPITAVVPANDVALALALKPATNGGGAA